MNSVGRNINKDNRILLYCAGYVDCCCT